MLQKYNLFYCLTYSKKALQITDEPCTSDNDACSDLCAREYDIYNKDQESSLISMTAAEII